MSTREVLPAIQVKSVRKEFRIPHEKRTTLFENLTSFYKPSSYEKFLALDDVSLTVNRGESIAIIGDNGSGKSTLLKIVAGILRPTAGSVEVNGKITPFLELGVGFQADLTAKENIEVYSTIMGLSGREIADNLSTVLEFAGLTKFKDTKLKNFSSGMQVRLAFATAIQVKPDILLIDEVLAVGDMEFQQKCLDIFSEYKKKGVTLVFVSHDLSSVRRFCDKTALLKNGRLVAFGPTSEIIDRYIYGIDRDEVKQAESVQQPATAPAEAASIAPAKSEEAAPEKKWRWGNRKMVITDVKLLDKYGRHGDNFNTKDPLKILVSYHASEPIADPVFGIAVYDERDQLCYGINTEIQGLDLGSITGDGNMTMSIPALTFVSGKFFLTVAIHTKEHVPYDWHDKKYIINVINTGRIAGVFDLRGEWIHG